MTSTNCFNLTPDERAAILKAIRSGHIAFPFRSPTNDKLTLQDVEAHGTIDREAGEVSMGGIAFKVPGLIKKGSRVRVRKLDRERWTTGASEVLEGLTGTVGSIMVHASDNRQLNALVTFDPHTRGHWHRNAHPENVSAFHFRLDELELLP